MKLNKAKVLEIKKDGRYLLIMPKDSQLTKIAPAIEKLFGKSKVLVLAVNDVNEIKIAELLKEKKK